MRASVSFVSNLGRELNMTGTKGNSIFFLKVQLGRRMPTIVPDNVSLHTERFLPLCLVHFDHYKSG